MSRKHKYEYEYEDVYNEEVIEEPPKPSYHNSFNQHVYEEPTTKSAVVGQMPVGAVNGEKINDQWMQVEGGYIQVKYIKEV